MAPGDTKHSIQVTLAQYYTVIVIECPVVVREIERVKARAEIDVA